MDTNATVGEMTGQGRRTVIANCNLDRLTDDLLEAYESQQFNRETGEAISRLPEDLQRHLFEKKGHRHFPKDFLGQLRAVSTVEALDQLLDDIASREKTYRTTISTSVKQEDGYGHIFAYVPTEYRDRILAILHEALEKADDIPADQKQTTLDMLAASNSAA